MFRFVFRTPVGRAAGCRHSNLNFNGSSSPLVSVQRAHDTAAPPKRNSRPKLQTSAHRHLAQGLSPGRWWRLVRPPPTCQELHNGKPHRHVRTVRSGRKRRRRRRTTRKKWDSNIVTRHVNRMRPTRGNLARLWSTPTNVNPVIPMKLLTLATTACKIGVSGCQFHHQLMDNNGMPQSMVRQSSN